MFIGHTLTIKHGQQNTKQADQPAPLPALEYKPLHGSHVGAFSCGEHEIDRFFRKHALNEHKKFHSRVTVAFFEGTNEVAAFYALSVRLVNEKVLAKEENRTWLQRYRNFNNVFICLNLEYVAVARKHQRQGLGKVLMGRVLEEFATIAKSSSIQLITGRAIDRDVFEFYKQLGFQEYGTDANQPLMFLPAISVIEMIDSVRDEQVEA